MGAHNKYERTQIMPYALRHKRIWVFERYSSQLISSVLELSAAPFPFSLIRSNLNDNIKSFKREEDKITDIILANHGSRTAEKWIRES